MKKRPELTQELVKSLFDYHEDGFLIWRVATPKRLNRAGSIAATLTKNTKYKTLYIFKHCFLEHRVIFLWHNGWLPVIVDHRDRDFLNNRNNNLRAATVSQNTANKEKKTGIASIYKGVRKINGKRTKPWRAIVGYKNRKINLGEFKTEIEAALAYNKGALKYHGEFSCLNIIKPESL